MSMPSAPIQQPSVQRCVVSIEHAELSGRRWLEVLEVHATAEDLAELSACLTRLMDRGGCCRFTIEKQSRH